MTKLRPPHRSSRSALAIVCHLALSLVLGACRPSAPIGPASPPDPTLDSPIGIETQQPSELDKRLEALAVALEKARVEHHVPGMAVAVVKDDSLVFARGFGSADLAKKTEVTPETLFSIGSSTKAFTATLVGMVAEGGGLAWDDPLEKHVPEFKLAIDAKDKSAKATIRDALCHRTGFTRMSMLWISGEVPRKEILAQATNAEPWAKHREKFLYNNVTYAAAGEAAARAAQGTWSELLANRILGPLGMTDTTAEFERARDDERRAQGYAWRSARKDFEPVPPRDITQVAPAGAIYSNVLDMSKWLRVQLGKGTFEGKTVIAKSVVEETWKEQFQIAPDNAYGLGWFLESWQGKRVIQHGGNIDGYSAMVAMIPEERLGLVVLANVGATPLQNLSRSMVWDAVLGEGGDAAGGETEDFSAFLGEYMANFGPFKDTVFAVTASGGKLHVDVPGQTNYEIQPPGKDGRRPFALTDTIAVSFEKADGGQVNVMRMHQGGLDFELPRKGYVPPPEIPLADLRKYEGTYTGDKLGETRVLIQHNRLAVDVPKQMIYELHPPDEQKKWKFRVKPEIAVEFVGSKPDKMLLHQSGQTIELARTGGATKPSKLPSVAVLQKKRGLAKTNSALDKLGTVEIVGRVRFAQAGIEGKLRVVADRNRAVIVMDLGRYGTIKEVILADQAWTENSFSPKTTHEGDYLAQALLGHPMTFLLDWTAAFDEIEVRGHGVHAGRDTVELAMTKGKLSPYSVAVASDTADVLQVKYTLLLDGQGGMPNEIRMNDYRTVLGLRLPHRTEIVTDANGRVAWTIESVRKFEGDPATLFAG